MVQQPMGGIHVHQQRVRQGGVSESRMGTVGTPVGVGVPYAGPELQMYMGPMSPEMGPVAPPWGPGQVLGGGMQPPGGPMMGAVEWQTQEYRATWEEELR